eukprot:12320-Heterococcus_DN1.PRE.14
MLIICVALDIVSGGAKRRLCLSIAMLASPKVVFLDEPSTASYAHHASCAPIYKGLDPVARRSVLAAISRIINDPSKQCAIGLKTRFGSGYQLEVTAALPTEQELSDASETLLDILGLPHTTQQLTDYDDIDNATTTTTIATEASISHEEMQTPKQDRKTVQDAVYSVFPSIANQTIAVPLIQVREVVAWSLQETACNNVMTFVAANCVGASLVEQQGGSLRLAIPQNAHTTMSLGDIFGMIEDNRQQLRIAEYALGQTSLEQIFTTFAAMQSSNSTSLTFSITANSTSVRLSSETARGAPKLTRSSLWPLRVMAMRLLCIAALACCAHANAERLAKNATAQLYLPAKDPDSNERAALLTAARKGFVTSRQFVTVDAGTINDLPVAKVHGRGAFDFVSDQAEHLHTLMLLCDTQNQVGAFIIQGSRFFNSANALENVVNAAFKSDALKLETLADFDMLYTFIANVSATEESLVALPVPELYKNWQTDASFGADHLTYLSQMLQRIDTVPAHFELSTETIHNITGGAKVSRDLYMVDLHYLVDLIDRNTTTGYTEKYTPGCIVLFYVNEDDDLMPLAIKLYDLDNDTLVYTPLDKADQWTLAKIAVGAAELSYMQFGYHFHVSHFAQQAITVESMRHLSVRHPLRVLLDHHLTQAFALVAIGNVTLLQPNTTIDVTTGCGSYGASRVFAKVAAEWDFKSSGYKTSMTARGLDDLKKFKYRDDATAIYDSIYTFVFQYLQLYYGKGAPSAAAIKEDNEVQAWAAAIHSVSTLKGCKRCKGFASFPKKFTTVASIATVVTEIIFKVAVEHHAINAIALWHAYPVMSRPLGLWYPLPKSKAEVLKPLRTYLAPNAIIAKQLKVLATFYRQFSATDTLVDSYSSRLALQSSAAVKVIEVFEKSMRKLTATIASREEGADRPFVTLSPDNLPFFALV